MVAERVRAGQPGQQAAGPAPGGVARVEVLDGAPQLDQGRADPGRGVALAGGQGADGAVQHPVGLLGGAADVALSEGSDLADPGGELRGAGVDSGEGAHVLLGTPGHFLAHRVLDRDETGGLLGADGGDGLGRGEHERDGGRPPGVRGSGAPGAEVVWVGVAGSGVLPSGVPGVGVARSRVLASGVRGWPSSPGLRGRRGARNGEAPMDTGAPGAPGGPARARLRVSSAAGPPGHRAQHLGGGHGRLAYAGQSLVDVVGVVRGGGGELGRGALRAEAVAYGELPQPGVGGSSSSPSRCPAAVSGTSVWSLETVVSG
ncbi:hypothetical protein SMICM17S_09091 [Streptomyces microflavus]